MTRLTETIHRQFVWGLKAHGVYARCKTHRREIDKGCHMHVLRRHNVILVDRGARHFRSLSTWPDHFQLLDRIVFAQPEV